MDDQCYFCAEYVPEGRMVCAGCEQGILARSRMATPKSFLLRTAKDGGGHLHVTFEDDGEHSLSEAYAYAVEALKLHPDTGSVRIRFEGDVAVLELVSYQPKFERLRRITGYLSNVDRWNHGKMAELHDRVMHEADGSVASGLICEESKEMATRRLPTVIAVRDMDLHENHVTGNHPVSLIRCGQSPARRGGAS